MNDNVRYSEARRLAMSLAAFCSKEMQPLLPLELKFPGVKVRVIVERITSVHDTQPLGGERHTCGDCGAELQIVRPGKYQCVNPRCPTAGQRSIEEQTADSHLDG